MIWADYFDSQGIQYAFFSAANAAAIQEARREAALKAQESITEPEAAEEEEEDGSEDEPNVPGDDSNSESVSTDEDYYFSADEEDVEDIDPRARVLSVLELEDLFVKKSPDLSGMYFNYIHVCSLC